MNIAAIKTNNIANGPGVRTAVFCSGCTHHCPQCFQPETWNEKFGDKYTPETEQQILDSLKPDYVSGITLLGGEPFEPSHRDTLTSLIKKVHELYPKKTIWAYSGYTFEELTGKTPSRCGNATDMLKLVDTLVDGEFKIDKKDISLVFRGSSNQRIIDVQKSLVLDKVVLSPEYVMTPQQQKTDADRTAKEAEDAQKTIKNDINNEPEL